MWKGRISSHIAYDGTCAWRKRCLNTSSLSFCSTGAKRGSMATSSRGTYMGMPAEEEQKAACGMRDFYELTIAKYLRKPGVGRKQ